MSENPMREGSRLNVRVGESSDRSVILFHGPIEARSVAQV